MFYADEDLTPKQEIAKISELLEEGWVLRQQLKAAEEDADPDLPPDERENPHVLAEQLQEEMDGLKQRLMSFYDMGTEYEYALEYLEEVREHTAAHDFYEAAYIVERYLEKALEQRQGRLWEELAQ